jgi:hypothetical protein
VSPRISATAGIAAVCAALRFAEGDGEVDGVASPAAATMGVTDGLVVDVMVLFGALLVEFAGGCGCGVQAATARTIRCGGGPPGSACASAARRRVSATVNRETRMMPDVQ